MLGAQKTGGIATMIEAYKLHRIDDEGNLWFFWNGWYKIPYESRYNPFRGIIPKECFKRKDDD